MTQDIRIWKILQNLCTSKNARGIYGGTFLIGLIEGPINIAKPVFISENSLLEA